MTHLFQCPHPDMNETRRAALTDFKKSGKKRKIPTDVLTAIYQTLHEHSNGGTSFHRKTHKPYITAAIAQQERIGLPLLHRGFLGKQWAIAMKETGSSHPDRRMNTLQPMLWEAWVTPIWTTRNNILHGPSNYYMVTENRQLAKEIAWYIENRTSVIAYQDQFVTDLDTNTMHRMSRAAKKRLLSSQKRLRDRYRIEKYQRSKGQPTILRSFGLVTGDERYSSSTDPPIIDDVK